MGELFKKCHDLVTDAGDGTDPMELGNRAVFCGVSEFPVRIKCASSPWHTLHAALVGKDDPVSMEKDECEAVGRRIAGNRPTNPRASWGVLYPGPPRGGDAVTVADTEYAHSNDTFRTAQCTPSDRSEALRDLVRVPPGPLVNGHRRFQSNPLFRRD
jgi:hypothetical protein